MSRLLRHVFLPIFVVITAFFSFNFNTFRVASQNWFAAHQLDSEQLVLDGLMHGYDKYGRLMLGRYSRPGFQDQYRLAHEFYAAGEKSGVFRQYNSQYGLQLQFFHLISSLGFANIGILQGISALLMSAVIGVLFLVVRRDFSEIPALLFAASLVFSPWVVVFARNLYWVEATWFIPVAITMYFGKAAISSSSSMLKMLTFLFIAFIIKFLCGYEYSTTILLASCAPILYQAILNHGGFKQCARNFTLVCLTCVFAFFVAVGIHVNSLSVDGSSGLSHIILLAKKRVSSDSPERTSREACYGNAACEKELKESLSSNSLKVTAKYFIFYDFLPWVASSEPIRAAETSILEAAYREPGFETARNAILNTGIDTKIAVLGKFFSAVLFIFFLILVFTSLLKSEIEIKALILVSFISPISWFYVAKGHSYVHYHMNYVLWYLPFIPFCIVVLSKSLSSVRTCAQNRL